MLHGSTRVAWPYIVEQHPRCSLPAWYPPAALCPGTLCTLCTRVQEGWRIHVSVSPSTSARGLRCARPSSWTIVSSDSILCAHHCFSTTGEEIGKQAEGVPRQQRFECRPRLELCTVPTYIGYPSFPYGNASLHRETMVAWHAENAPPPTAAVDLHLLCGGKHALH